MGRNLAFADINIIGCASDLSLANGVRAREVFECNGTKKKQERWGSEAEAGRMYQSPFAGPLSKIQVGRNDNQDGDRSKSVVQIVFRRHSPSWDRYLDDTFPTKNSELPYGAKVHLKLNLTHREESRAKVGGNSTTPRYEVQQWSILEDPRVEAKRDARQQKTAIELESPSAETKIDANTDGSLEAGISCSKYFSSRMNQYLKYNPNPSRDGDRKSQSGRLKGDEDEKKNSVDEKLNPRAIMDNGASPGHGNKKDKALRAKIFASFLIRKFGSELFQDQEKGLCHEILRTDGIAPTPAPARILDVAGGKGQLSIELAIQTNCLVQCTIIDPLIRGKGNEATLKRRDVKRIQKAHKQRRGIKILTPLSVPSACEDEREQQQARDQDESPLSQCVQTPVPLPVYISKCFTLQDEECMRMVKESSLIVGLHPDEPTEDIIDAAIENNIPAAIVPCCVFAYLRPERRLKKIETRDNVNEGFELDKKQVQVNRKDGKGHGAVDQDREVRSYDHFIKYLMEKDPRIEKATLPFEGRNIVLTFNPR